MRLRTRVIQAPSKERALEIIQPEASEILSVEPLQPSLVTTAEEKVCDRLVTRVRTTQYFMGARASSPRIIYPFVRIPRESALRSSDKDLFQESTHCCP